MDTERYFRAVDRAVMEHFSKPSGLPLVLACLPTTRPSSGSCPTTRTWSRTVPGDPGGMSLDKLRAEAWKVIEPRYLARLAG